MRAERRCFGFFPFILTWDVPLIMARREKKKRDFHLRAVCVFLPLYLVSFCHTKNALFFIIYIYSSIKHRTWENKSVCMFSAPVWVEYMCQPFKFFFKFLGFKSDCILQREILRRWIMGIVRSWVAEGYANVRNKIRGNRANLNVLHLLVASCWINTINFVVNTKLRRRVEWNILNNAINNTFFIRS